MMRETITTNADHAAKSDTDAHAPRYALIYAPGATRASLKASVNDAGGAELTPKLAGELIEDLTIFIEQTKRKPRRPRKALRGYLRRADEDGAKAAKD